MQTDTARHSTIPQAGIADARAAMKTLCAFMGSAQRRCVASLLTGEEGQFFIDKLVELAAVVANMPTTYAQESLGDKALVHLHYFIGGADWYITEKDLDTDGAGQIQAFGMVNMGHGPEMGYVSLREILAGGAELDFQFTPKTLAAITTRRK